MQNLVFRTNKLLLAFQQIIYVKSILIVLYGYEIKAQVLQRSNVVFVITDRAESFTSIPKLIEKIVG